MKNTLSCLSLLFIFVLVGCDGKEHLKKDMLQFDRALIPVFYYTSVGDFSSAQKAMYPLRSNWEHYQSIHHLKDKRLEGWEETIRRIGDWLDEVDCALEEMDAYRAIVQLDHARYELVDLRLRENIDDYFLDYLWDFEASMYTAIDVANDPMIDLLEFNEFTLLTDEVMEAWNIVLRKGFDKDLFELNTEQTGKLNDQKDKLTDAVFLLLKAVETADRCQFADAAIALEPAYLNYLVMFGDFEAVESYYVLKK